ncbi:MAG: hypothetical protein HY332_26020 [Chloroflexi bacterium]|nr:hypothetical protein [Chloroflexota bacterium]
MNSPTSQDTAGRPAAVGTACPAGPAATIEPEQLHELTPPAAAALLEPASPDEALAALRRYARAYGEAVFRLLSGLAERGTAPVLQAAAIEALGDVRIQQAADLAAKWSTDRAPKELRKAARRALLKLGQQGIRPAVEHAPAPPTAAAPRRERIRRAMMSLASGRGGRGLYLLLDHPTSGAYLVRAVISQVEGLERFEAAESSARQFERFLEQERAREGAAWAEIPPAYARYLIAEAVEASRATGRGLPPAHHTFRDALAVGEDEQRVPPLPPAFDDDEARGLRYRSDLVDETDALLEERPEIVTWLPPLEPIEPLAAEWRRVARGPLTLPPAVLAQRREAVMDHIVEHVLGPGGAEGFQRRLADNALVLLRSGDLRNGRRALAAALALDPPTLETARRHPLVRALAQRALALALGSEGAEPGRLPLVEADTQQTAIRQEPPGTVRPSGLILPD